MARIDRHTITDAPEASRPLLEGILPFSPTGKLLTMHAQMAHSPAVLAAYASIRQAYFLNYAQTPLDLPAGPAAADEPE